MSQAEVLFLFERLVLRKANGIIYFPSHQFELMPSGWRFTAVNRELKDQATLWLPQQLWYWI